MTAYWYSTRQTRSTADYPVFVDKNGKVAINLFREGQDGGMQSFSEGLAAYYVETEDRRSNMGRRLELGYIDRTGRVVIRRVDTDGSKFSLGEHGGDFSEGMATFPERGKWGYIDRSRYFNEGVAVVSIGDKNGFVDKSGRVTFVPGVIDIHNFHDGIAVVMRERGHYCGYIDKRGKFVVKMENRTASSFREGLGLVWPYSGTTLAKDAR